MVRGEKEVEREEKKWEEGVEVGGQDGLTGKITFMFRPKVTRERGF